MAMVRLLAVVVILLGAGGCSARIPPAGEARLQAPAGGSPDRPWVAMGRATVEAPGLRLSCRAVVRRLPDGAVRLALLADEGLLLLDLTQDAAGTTIHAGQPALRSRAELIGRAALAWVSLPLQPGHWADDRWVVPTRAGACWYGGDPLRLRRITGPGPEVDVGDYRLREGGLLAQVSHLHSPGFDLTLRLGDEGSGP
jgi:hypothetical protein